MQSTNRNYRVHVLKSDLPLDLLPRHCNLGISVGAHFHEKKKFQATIQWTQQHFKSCTILVFDTLQRFNDPAYFAGNFDEAMMRSIHIGDEWINRNLDTINEGVIPFSISRWDCWRNHLKFEMRHKSIASYFAKNQSFQAMVLNDVNRFIRNNPSNKFGLDATNAQRKDSGVSYILEELAGYSIFVEEHGALEIYGGPKLKSLQFLKKYAPQEIPNSLLELTSIKIGLQKSCHDSTESLPDTPNPPLLYKD